MTVVRIILNNIQCFLLMKKQNNQPNKQQKRLLFLQFISSQNKCCILETADTWSFIQLSRIQCLKVSDKIILLLPYNNNAETMNLLDENFIALDLNFLSFREKKLQLIQLWVCPSALAALDTGILVQLGVPQHKVC